jgi:hypothetical protein
MQTFQELLFAIDAFLNKLVSELSCPNCSLVLHIFLCNGVIDLYRKKITRSVMLFDWS